jgi:hypothetical protein
VALGQLFAVACRGPGHLQREWLQPLLDAKADCAEDRAAEDDNDEARKGPAAGHRPRRPPDRSNSSLLRGTSGTAANTALTRR